MKISVIKEKDCIQTTKNWIKTFVIELNLCPFAQAEIKRDSIRYALSYAQNEEALLHEVVDELNVLESNDDTETTLLIMPSLLKNFNDYVNFLALCDDLLQSMQLEGIYQVASFHPHYQFENTPLDCAENFSNRSPYPMLHILREHSLEKAILRYPNTQTIPENNIKTLNQLGLDDCKARLNNCYVESKK